MRCNGSLRLCPGRLRHAWGCVGLRWAGNLQLQVRRRTIALGSRARYLTRPATSSGLPAATRAQGRTLKSVADGGVGVADGGVGVADGGVGVADGGVGVADGGVGVADGGVGVADGGVGVADGGVGIADVGVGNVDDQIWMACS
eukprot:3993449-Pleurochrysis_carterae.AAC.2